MRMWPHQIYPRALRGEQLPGGRPAPSKAEAAAMLREMYQQDFGEGAERWRAWLRHNWQKAWKHRRGPGTRRARATGPAKPTGLKSDPAARARPRWTAG